MNSAVPQCSLNSSTDFPSSGSLGQIEARSLGRPQGLYWVSRTQVTSSHLLPGHRSRSSGTETSTYAGSQVEIKPAVSQHLRIFWYSIQTLYRKDFNHVWPFTICLMGHLCIYCFLFFTLCSFTISEICSLLKLNWLRRHLQWLIMNKCHYSNRLILF